VLEKGVFRSIFKTTRGKKQGTGENYMMTSYTSPNIARMIKLNIMRCTGHVARMEERCIKRYGGGTKRNDTTKKM
jgi:hypothetical protein